MPKTFDWLIVGAGFTGAVLAERLATQSNKRVLLVDRRNHIAGNAFDEFDSQGVQIHRYGPHIFHTNSEKVWSYLSQFTEWRPYFHRVLAHIDGHFAPLPFNLDSIAQVFPSGFAAALTDKLIAHYGYGKRVTILAMRESTDPEIKFLADFVYEKVFLNYTQKQWGCAPEALDSGVTSRVPLLINRDSRYFQDRFQAMPKAGYTKMFERILQHPNIELRLGEPWEKVEASAHFERVVFTGPIDSYFGYKHGALPYRSLRFEFEQHDNRQQAVGTVNYPNEFEFTRTTEFSYLTGQKSTPSTIVYEYPIEHIPGKTEPYYPVPNPETSQALAPYLDEARKLNGKVWFAGRLGDYAYYNMDQACARALTLFEKKLASL
jgi:UDP-galactopyranose mutase